MPFDRSEPPESLINKWFLTAPAAPPRTFEFALVLGGTVSAGAYTAGAVDFLIEALDCFTTARANGAAPKHDVILKLITGTSGGGVNAAIAARALAYDYPHVTLASPIGEALTGNPFYDIWIKTLRLDRFLKTNDITDQVPSLLNGEAIDAGANYIASFEHGPAKARAWVGDPLRVILTLTSLRGVPYRTQLGTRHSQTYIDHADYARFAFVYPGRTLTEEEVRPDEQVLGFGTESLPQPIAWRPFSEFAKATAAFPAGFPARALSRPTSHYRWRVVPYPPVPESKKTYMWVPPDWAAMAPPGGDVPEMWDFLAVDGGATNNEPIQLARTALAGLLGRSPRDPATASRAIWLIDPFAGRAALGPTKPAPFASELGAIVTTLTQQTRYSTADVLMAADENEFSRYMLSPYHDGRTGEDAIASGGVGAFIGFACADFMRFDYLLGRSNCQDYLLNEFVLSNNNPLFEGWTDDERKKFVVASDPTMLPIVPLVGSAAAPQPLPDWPRGKLDPDTLRGPIEARFRAVFAKELSGDPIKAVLGITGGYLMQRTVADYVIDTMKAYLAKAGLA
ncbi:MAG: patatin-like phospholipase family protein [Alphaproteobacteria bacterium]|nr:patatin-like phospholipase family protein [Alphaproteobacteria bacterium]